MQDKERLQEVLHSNDKAIAAKDNVIAEKVAAVELLDSYKQEIRLMKSDCEKWRENVRVAKEENELFKVD